MHNLVALANLVIPNGTKPSNAVEVSSVEKICLIAPATLTGTITLQVSLDNTNFFALQSAGSDITIAASKAIQIDNNGYKWLRVNSGSDEGAARTFLAGAHEEA